MLSAGHRLQEIKRYTLRQMDGFVELANLDRKYRLESIMNGMRAAYHAGAKGWRNIMKTLNDG